MHVSFRPLEQNIADAASLNDANDTGRTRGLIFAYAWPLDSPALFNERSMP